MRELENLIDELSIKSQRSKEEIIRELSNFAKFKFGSPISEKEEDIIKIIQNKLIIGLYKMPDHSYVTSRPDYKRKFNFSALEMDYLAKAANELGDLDILEGNDNYTKLTKSGIFRAKELLGEI